jgi:hypothetical protein
MITQTAAETFLENLRRERAQRAINMLASASSYLIWMNEEVDADIMCDTLDTLSDCKSQIGETYNYNYSLTDSYHYADKWQAIARLIRDNSTN